MENLKFNSLEEAKKELDKVLNSDTLETPHWSIYKNCIGAERLTFIMTTERRLAALLTLSWLQEQSRCHKI